MDRVEAAFRAHPRARFLPAQVKWRARHDGPLTIGAGQTSSQPRTVDAMLRLLEVPVGARVLDVGAGSGWSTALLAHLVGPAGQVIGVELIPALTRFGSKNLARTEQPWARIEQVDAETLGWPTEAPYDRILVSAEARRLPKPLIEQLADHGRLVVPVAGTMTVVVRAAGDFTVTEHGPYRFVPLIGS
ncbi:protein-L-isoaspartate O-methyltransferase family protein [Nocardioides gilvus]|uniref:protein-L-isoaspartate O-methyltransferase family protein n=1 Tax=Nocardioides gilvus TaxID=1735589 RepID=UPI000D747086|nr:methyltransferase domain-containing protein [Nocardioides gilvus]